MSTELTQQQGGAVTPTKPTIIDIINKLTDSPSLSLEAVQALTQLVALQREQEAQHRKELFFEALARVQTKAPRIRKDGMMDRGPGKGQIPYARREDIDAMMRPIYQAEGFSVTWDAPMGDSRIRVIGRFTAFGHTEEREWSCLPDSSGGKQNPQAAGSTVSYGQRYISTMFWDVITEDEDKNGAKTEDVTPITENQALDIRTRMNDLPQSKPGNLLAKLCQKYGVKKPEDLRVSQYDAAIADVEATEKRFAK
jgi:hypothetical protein